MDAINVFTLNKKVVMSKIINHANFVGHYTFYDDNGKGTLLAGETFHGQISKTVPGMTLSLKDLLARYVRGEQVEVFSPVYSDDPDIPDNLELMSVQDRLDAAREIRGAIDVFQREKKEAAAAPPPPPPPPPSSVEGKE